jgi:putative transposase
MILTYKIKHNKDFSSELNIARKIANYAVKTKSRSSKDVKHFGLKSQISNQILKKYSKNKKCKAISSVKLTVPNQGIKINQETRTIKVPVLKLELTYQFPNNFTKINQIEVDNTYCFVSCEVPNEKETNYKDYIGIDLNTTGHCAVIAIPKSNKVIKLGKSANHIHLKYKNLRAKLQKKGAKQQLKKIKKREQNIIKDLNHKISKKIVQVAKKNNCGIKLEKLTKIREKRNKKTQQSFKYSLNSWSFYQLNMMIEYKAKILGIPVAYINPAYTSQRCSKCGVIGNRNGKEFKCVSCGHVDHADSNAAFNIAAFELLNNIESNGHLVLDRDNTKRNTDILRLESQMRSENVAFVN